MVHVLVNKFFYQGSRMGTFIYQGLVISALCLAIILQMESVGVSWLAIILALAVVLLALCQFIRYQAELSGGVLRLYKLLPSNTMELSLRDLKVNVVGRHTLQLTGSPYGTIEITTLGHADKVADSINILGGK